MGIIVVIVLIIALIFGFCWLISGIEANKINKSCGTKYTTSDIFWFGDKIIISDHMVIKEK